WPPTSAAAAPDGAQAQLRAHAAAGRHAVWLRPGDGFRVAPFDAIAASLAQDPWPCELHPGIASAGG
ncbi:hypothetical protein ACQYWP_18440, partial [Luteimonas sp. SDU101]